MNSKKNVIVICIDGGRADRAKNSPIFSENLSTSIFFPQTITYAPYTNSSVYALISGSYGNRNGCFSYWHSIKFKKNKFKTLTQYLHENNYYTQADVHSWLILPKEGFDKYEVYDEENVDLINRHQQLLEYNKKIFDEKKNFFLYLHYSDLHYGIKKSVLQPYNNFSKEYFDNKELNEKRYDQLFQKAENYLNNIFEKIDDLGLAKDSIILIISDHGVSLGEKFGERAYGAFCYDYTIKTFSCLSLPEFQKNEITQQIRHVDFMPTILDLLDISLDKEFESLDGVSLVPLIHGKNFEEKIAYSETANPLNEKAPPKKPNTKSVRTSNWKLIFNEYNNTKELYNLNDDPNEENNLIGENLEIESVLWNELLKLQNNN